MAGAPPGGADPDLAATEAAEREEQRLRPAIHRVLRVGSAIGAALMIAGLVLLASAGGPFSAADRTRLDGASLHTALTVPSATGLLVLGVIVIALTPLSRVALAAGIFASVHDRPMLAVASFVMLILATTVVVGVLL